MVNGQRLTTDELAALVADALLHAEIVTKDKFEGALKVIAEEINVRKWLGDY